jgi:hypothetical protein
MMPTAILTYLTAYGRAVELRHHPIEKCQPGALGLTHFLRGAAAILDGRHLIAYALKGPLEQPQRERVIVCD